MRLCILVASQLGLATRVAQAIQLACDDLASPIDLLPMDGLDLSVFDDAADTVYLICSSTTGSGDVPDSGQALLAAFDAAPRYLGHVRYGVIALGDSSYGDTYCQGALRFDEKLQDLGAQRLGEVWRHDAMGDEDAEVAAPAWASDWLQRCAA